MAEFFLGPVSERLHSLIGTEFATISGIKEKAEKLSSTLDLIKAVLEDAEKKQIKERSVKVWLQQLKDAAYELDDILDECSIQSHRLSGCRSLFRPKDIKLRHGLGKELEDIAERFNQIAEAKNKFSLREGVRERPSEAADWPQTISFLPQHPVYGRDGDKKKILEFLLREAHCSDSLAIYPIVGLGGIGKTTLAQLVYNDEQVTKHFDIKIWVCVSDDFTAETILGSIINEKHQVANLDATARKVKELLQNKRYLLVLDDVWKANENLKLGLTQHRWNTLKSVLSCGSKGASILVSTRDVEVAAMMKTCQHHHSLSVLSDDDCWLLFKRCAFGSEEEDRPDLVEIGRELLQKCGKSPLAILALGGALHSMSTKAEWLDVRDSWLWTLQDDILPALRLSYFHLTPTLKQCFAFCAIFPKDTRIWKEELIHLWIANGFISSMRGLEVEKVGNRIWQELYQKLLFQDVEKDDYSRDISFKMHDLVHDLAQSIMGQECLIMKNTNMADLSKSTHHISFDCNLDVGVLEKVKSLRTLYQLECPLNKKCSGYFPTNCSLRVLRISSFELSSLGNLIHLRYLELHDSETKTLPDSICSLQKLEILKLVSCLELSCLPKHMSCLQNLRHLVIFNCFSLSDMFANIGNLSCLRTLSKYIVSSEQGHSLSELQNLKLGGELEITGLEFVGSKREAGEANLRTKEDLKELHLCWKRGFFHDNNTAEQVLEALEPHPNLNTLRIKGYEGFHFPRWIGDLTSLVILQLDGSTECKQLPSLGKLPLLRKLEITGPMEIVYMDEDECYDRVEVMAFPSLEELKLYRLPKLERLLKVERMNMCPRLSILRIDGCPELKLLPCHPSIKHLHFKGPNNKSLSSISSFIGLTFLTLWGDKTTTLTSFPEGMMRNLTCLEYLTIQCFEELKKLPDELFYLKALESLNINSCPKLECLPEQVWEGLCSLQRLEISGCEGLRSLPEGIRHLTSLRSLSISGCEGLRSLPEGIRHLTSLQQLIIKKCEGLRSLPEGIRHLISLQQLIISGCEGLRSLPEGIRHLTSLQYLSISECERLRSLPEGIRHLTSLHVLFISECEGLRSLPEGIRHLTSLQQLIIKKCEGLRSLEGIRHLTSLQVLSISECEGMSSLPEGIRHLTSLRSLVIIKCEGLRSLPEGIRHLTSLKDLVIVDCPTLIERCKKGIGEDWDKIAHVPHVQI